MPLSLDSEHQSLAKRANRSLGESLVELGLVTYSELEEAQELIAESEQLNSNEVCSLISVFDQHLQVLNEDSLLGHLVELYGLRRFEISEESTFKAADFPLEDCWTTWSIPYSRNSGSWVVVSAYYLSEPVKAYWNRLLGGEVSWRAASTAEITKILAAR